MKDFTAIYVESWMSGSHQHSLTKMKRFTLEEGEKVADALKRLGIIDSTVYLFVGHPLLQGE